MSAPIGLFAYNRPEHLARVLRSLARCPELATSPLTVFCDGAKPGADKARIDETRRVARELAPPHANIVEREVNFGLRASITTGVTSLCNEHGRAIIVEDDLEVSSTFLRFMNDALERYRDEPNIMQVSGYMYPFDVDGPCDALFMPATSCWGWGVWARSWSQFGSGASTYDKLVRDPALRHRFDLDGHYPYFDMLSAQHHNKIDSWGIAWYLDVFAASGLCLYPRKSLVANRGHDGSGAHREESSPFEAQAHEILVQQLPEPRLDAAQFRRVCELIGRANHRGLVARVGGLLKRAKGMWSG